jgi:putative phosphoribosyl transferase
MRVALRALRAMEPARTVVAVPVAAEETCTGLRSDADEVICANKPHPFGALGRWYRNFSPTGDDEVRSLLALATRSP